MTARAHAVAAPRRASAAVRRRPASVGLRVGNRALARLAAAGAVVQRRVGFEFEDGFWHPWYRGYWRAGRVWPVERKKVIHTGVGFTLQADDTPGPRLSNIEFVTDPFEETNVGLQALRTTMLAIGQVVQTLDPLIGRPGPGGGDDPPAPPHDYDPNDYVTNAQHHLNGSREIPAWSVLLSDGRAGGRFKMQATAGIALRDMPTVMETFGAAPGETGRERRDREPARRSVAGPNWETTSELAVMGAAPGLARAVARRLAAERTFSQTERILFRPVAVDELVGFLSQVILTMKMLQVPLDKELKKRLPLMSRTSFAPLFALLPQPQRRVLTAHPGAFTSAVLAVSNANPLIRFQGVDRDRGLTRATPLVASPPRRPTARTVARPHERLSMITIGRWLDQLARGGDVLMPDEVGEALDEQWPWTWFWASQRTETVELLESFGSIGGSDAPARPGGPRLGVFENRAIAPVPGGYLRFTDAYALAWNQLLFYKRIQDARATGRPVGAYPTVAAGVIPP